MDGIHFIGTGSYVPDRIVTNDDMAKIVDTSDEWISTRTGILARHTTEGEPTSHMALAAARRALAAGGVTPEEIDMVVCSTITPDCHTPSVACIVQGQLGAKNAFGMDISAACSGFVYALDMARHYIRAGDVRTALVISAEQLTHITNFSDRASCVLFGDGAGACVIRAGDERYGAYLGSDGVGAPTLYASIPYPLSPFETREKRNALQAFAQTDDGFVYMDGKEVYKFSTAVMGLSIEKACERIGITPQDIDLIVPHQANIRIIQTGMKHLGLPMERAFMNIDRYGNTSSASVPLALDEAVREGRVRRGDVVALVGFGAGLTFGAAVFDY